MNVKFSTLQIRNIELNVKNILIEFVFVYLYFKG